MHTTSAPSSPTVPLAAPARIGIAGAGVLGRLLAWQLAQRGHHVTVFDPASTALPDYTAPRPAGFTAAGMLSPIAELDCANWALAQLGWRSLALWRQYTAALGAQGHSVYFAQRGSLLLAHGSDMGTAQRMISGLRSKAPAAVSTDTLVQPLTPPQLHDMEPDVSRQLRGWLLPDEGQIHTIEALTGLAAAAQQLGASFRWKHSARHVTRHAIDGEPFDWVLDVRGLGARDSNLPDSPAPDTTPQPDEQTFVQHLDGDSTLPLQPTRGVRGEVFILHAPGVVLHRPARLMHPRHRVYVVPRPNDLIVVGASEIESEDRSPVSLRTTVELLAAAHAVLPALTEARIVHTETNLRPTLPDNLPRITVTDGLTRINGLFRHGWLIAPALAEHALHASGL